jgi:NADPH:quinone reductase-like Zn-dependent oxidoreductase
MRLIPVLLPSLATALVAPARPLTVTPARLAPLQAGAVADAEKLKVAPKLESPPVDSSGTLPKVNGGIVIGTRKLAVVTGASSGLGLYGALSLAKRGDYYVVLACRNVERAERVAKEMGFPANSYTVIKCELGSFKSVRDFVFNLRAFKGPRGLDALVCNAAVYLPVRAAASSVILNVSASTPSS